MIPSPPVPGATPPAPGRSRAVVGLTALSIVLALALVAVSLAWWTERDEASADGDDSAAVTTTTTAGPAEPPAAGSDEGDEPFGDLPDDGGLPDGADEPFGDLPDDGEASEESDNPLEGLLDGLLGGDLGQSMDQLSGLSPECLGGSIWDLLGGLGGGEELTGTLAEQVQQIADSVEQHRGLQFTEPVEPKLVPAEEFDQNMAEMVTEEYRAGDADIDSRILSLLGAIPEGTDLRALQSDLLAGQVAGYYDPETGDIVVRDDGDGEMDATERLTLAHELDHALTDQALGLPDTDVEGQSDANLAGLALVEGDATLLMQQWALTNLGLADQFQQLLDPQVAQAQADLEKVPPYLRQELMFPYLNGLSYACRLFVDGEWPAVDAAYDTPPATTAEILYEDREGVAPVDPTDPGRLDAPWIEARRDTIGAAQLQWLFSAPGGDEDAALAEASALASRWAGGEMVLATNADHSALGVSLVDRADGMVLCDAVERWYDASFDDERTVDGTTATYEAADRVAVLSCDGRDVRLGIGPDHQTAAALVG